MKSFDVTKPTHVLLMIFVPTIIIISVIQVFRLIYPANEQPSTPSAPPAGIVSESQPTPPLAPAANKPADKPAAAETSKPAKQLSQIVGNYRYPVRYLVFRVATCCP
jgi:hypothetical protein